MLNLFKRRAPQFFSVVEQEEIVEAIRQSETNTSGEIRLYVESHCKYVNALDRALEVFGRLNMYETAKRNGVLVYIALKDKQLAIFADDGIYKVAGEAFWKEEVQQMVAHFNKKNYAEGLKTVILQIGRTLSNAFPYDAKSDKNELPDDIVYGR